MSLLNITPILLKPTGFLQPTSHDGFHTPIRSCGSHVHRSTTHRCSPVWPSLIERLLSSRDNVGVACRGRNSYPDSKEVRHTNPPIRVGKSKCNPPGLANRWPRLDLAPRHVSLDFLYNALNILEISYKNQATLSFLKKKKRKRGLWHH